MATKITTRVLEDNAVTDAKIADVTLTTSTQSASDNTTKIATTAYVTTALANLADSAPSTLNTLNELAAALGDDANYATTTTNAIATKLPLAGGAMTGDLTVVDSGGLGLTTSGYSILSAANNARAASGSIRIGDGAGSTGLVLDYTDQGQTVATIRNAYVGSATSELTIQSPFITFDTGTSYTERMRITSTGWVNASGNVATANPPDSAGLFLGWNHSNGVGENNIVFNKGAGSNGGLVFSDNSADGSLVERMQIDGVGKVGINGTPAGQLHVFGDDTTAIDNAQKSYDNSRIRFNSYSNSSAGMSFFGVNQSNVAGIQGSYNQGTVHGIALNPFGGNVGVGTSAPDAALKVITAETNIAAGWIRGPNYGLRVSAGSTDAHYALRIANSSDAVLATFNGDGKVGIGISAPAQKLHVSGTSRFDDTMYFAARGLISWGSLAGGTGYGIQAGSGNGLSLGSNGQWDKLIIDTAGKVGIATTSPNSMLEVSFGDNASTQRWSYGAARTNFYLELDTFIPSGGVVAYSFDMKTNGTAYNNNLVLDRGKVGIGIATPGAGLHVVTATAGFAAKLINNNSASDSNGLLIQSGTAISEYSLKVTSTDGNTPFMVVKGNGRVGIGIASPSSTVTIHNSTVTGNTQLHIHNNKTGDAGVLRIEGGRTSTNDSAQIILANGGSIGSAIKMYSAAQEGDLRFYTSPASSGNTLSERMRIHTGGVTSFNNGIELGSGLDATAANVLDDYEVGTWTPVIRGLGGNNATFTVNETSYIKVGKLVHLTTYIHSIDLAAITSGSYIVMTGLPFAASNYGDFSISYRSGSFVEASAIVGGYVQAGQAYVYFLRPSGTEAQQGTNTIAVTKIMINITYKATT